MRQLIGDQYNSSGANDWNARYIWDAMDLCGISVKELAQVRSISLAGCMAELKNGLQLPSTRASWIASIFKSAKGSDAPAFTTIAEWENYIVQQKAALGSGWKDNPSGVIGFARSYHKQIEKIKCAGQQNNKDQQKEVKNG